MANVPSGESLASPAGTSGRSEISEDDEDVAMETDPSKRYIVHSSSAYPGANDGCSLAVVTTYIYIYMVNASL